MGVRLNANEKEKENKISIKNPLSEFFIYFVSRCRRYAHKSNVGESALAKNNRTRKKKENLEIGNILKSNKITQNKEK